MSLCREYGFMYLERPNEPLGHKFNEGLRVFKNIDVDYIIIMGSDDLISNNLIEAYMPFMKKRKDVIGILDIYFYDILEKQLHYLSGYGLRPQDKHRKGESLGLARCIKRDVVERLGWQLWMNGINKGLDWTMTQRLKRFGVRPIGLKLRDIGALAVDLKSGNNICGVNIYRTTIVGNSIMSLLSDKELKMIKCYGT